MAIVVTCSACNTRLTLGDDRAGDRFECPQCDATIKVPGPSPLPAGAAAAPTPVPPAKPEPDFDPESEHTGPDKRVLIGVLAGVAALLLVGVAGVVLAVRQPAEVAKTDPEPSPPSGAFSGTSLKAPTGPDDGQRPDTKPPNGAQPGGKQPGASGPGGSGVQPVTPAPTVLTQYQATFLGSQGRGRRFCIIADSSDSMRGAKLADLKTQLLKTLDDLNPDAEYYVFAFNARPEPMPHPTWLRAGAPETGKVKAWVKGLGTRLGTLPVPAFEAAFGLDPPPDVIFFMTDGQFAAAVPGKVAGLNGAPRKSVVNTILFAAAKGPAPSKAAAAEGLLKQIADQNGGTFTRYAP
ncbi:MAG: hypothetical protein J0I06_15975 [Planctomycetes bacterium]|nr:hypothetical protein [Planctomycetota bacterium]